MSYDLRASDRCKSNAAIEQPTNLCMTSLSLYNLENPNLNGDLQTKCVKRNGAVRSDLHASDSRRVDFFRTKYTPILVSQFNIPIQEGSSTIRNGTLSAP